MRKYENGAPCNLYDLSPKRKWVSDAVREDRETCKIMPAARVSRLLNSSQVEEKNTKESREKFIPVDLTCNQVNLKSSQIEGWLDANPKDDWEGDLRQLFLLRVRDRLLRVKTTVDEKTHLQEK